MDGRFVGHVSRHDPLHGFLERVLRERMGVHQRDPVFRAHRMSGSNEVYAYEEATSRTRLVCKFFGPRFGWDRDRAAWTAGREYAGYQTLRRYSLVGSPHHVVRPLGFDRDINCVLALEYYRGELLVGAIDRAVRGDGALLRSRLTALAWYLATQHNRTANGEGVDFGTDLGYLDLQLGILTDRGRIGSWEVEELRWLGGLWAERTHMWSDQQVWLHGDATPANFLFGGGMDVGAIDLERMRRGDRMFDVGRVAGELQHAFLLGTGDAYRGEPYLGHFLWEYSCHFPDRAAAFASTTRRLPYYMAMNMLRIARNDYISRPYGDRLVQRARELLRAR
ncbi:phosphotransferase family protein [Pseudonocardia pini]|uniref:phosphotransferase family protein n=1 Tax=Pseudonocardia pini TaxID=2758030 RepID=UPI001C68B010|nr:phosphotransferase [Pseudonocardia pini]